MLRTVDGRDFYIDLVFYHYVLKCFVLVASPIGIVLCADKIDALVRYTLPEENKQIFASKYMLYLPTEEQLKNEIKEVL
ncbi:hypothetical protein AGMMS49938_04340 [Fibrobacterales bacterium]|nr:hypothetical protein AGMMS49938_04340 [Fibrobacterales bacterium]